MLSYISQLHEQNIFMDVLASCGTDDCLDVFLECIQNDQVGRIDGSMFLQSLASYHTVTETFLGKMFVSLNLCRAGIN